MVFDVLRGVVMEVYVRERKKNPGTAFRKAHEEDMRTQNSGQVFFRKHESTFGLDRMSSPAFVPLASRETLYGKRAGGQFVVATEKEAARGRAYRYKHDPFMPSMDKVKATEFKKNRWRYLVRMAA